MYVVGIGGMVNVLSKVILFCGVIWWKGVEVKNFFWFVLKGILN